MMLLVRLRISSRLSSFSLNYSTRVRFAPSPTGRMHLGGLRTALINYLFAKSNNGQFILRIEDTDRSRLVPEALDDIRESLEWAGIPPDEGPGYGGGHGPYVQSERKSIYQKYVQLLLEQDKAYRCFCSEERLELLKREQRRQKETPKYDGKCRSLPTHKTDPTKPHVIRFKLQSQLSTFHDIICGTMTFDRSHQEGDPVIMKSDGMPVYHLANVVDDHLMEITHVIRGAEWLPSIYKHLQLYEAFGWSPPQFAHLPLMLNERNHKISKRDKDYEFYEVKSLSEMGHFPQSILSWILSCGGGFVDDVWSPSITLTELMKKFELERITKHNAQIQLETLRHIGLAHYHRMLSEDKEHLVNQTASFIKNITKGDCHLPEPPQFLDQLTAVDGRISKLSDFRDVIFIWQDPQLSMNHFQFIDFEVLKQFLHRSLQLSSRGAFIESSLEGVYQDLCSKPQAMKILRLILTGNKEGPRIQEILNLLSPEVIHRRVLTVIELMTVDRENIL